MCSGVAFINTALSSRWFTHAFEWKAFKRLMDGSA